MKKPGLGLLDGSRNLFEMGFPQKQQTAPETGAVCLIRIPDPPLKRAESFTGKKADERNDKSGPRLVVKTTVGILSE